MYSLSFLLDFEEFCYKLLYVKILAINQRPNKVGAPLCLGLNLSYQNVDVSAPKLQIGC